MCGVHFLKFLHYSYKKDIHFLETTSLAAAFNIHEKLFPKIIIIEFDVWNTILIVLTNIKNAYWYS